MTEKNKERHYLRVRYDTEKKLYILTETWELREKGKLNMKLIELTRGVIEEE